MLLCIEPTNQLQDRFALSCPKLDRHTRGKWLIQAIKHPGIASHKARNTLAEYHTGALHGNVFSPVFLKEVRGPETSLGGV